VVWVGSNVAVGIRGEAAGRAGRGPPQEVGCCAVGVEVGREF